MAAAFGAGAALLAPVLLRATRRWLATGGGVALALWLGAVPTAGPATCCRARPRRSAPARRRRSRWPSREGDRPGRRRPVRAPQRRGGGRDPLIVAGLVVLAVRPARGTVLPRNGVSVAPPVAGARRSTARRRAARATWRASSTVATASSSSAWPPTDDAARTDRPEPRCARRCEGLVVVEAHRGRASPGSTRPPCARSLRAAYRAPGRGARLALHRHGGRLPDDRPRRGRGPRRRLPRGRPRWATLTARRRRARTTRSCAPRAAAPHRRHAALRGRDATVPPDRSPAVRAGAARRETPRARRRPRARGPASAGAPARLGRGARRRRRPLDRSPAGPTHPSTGRARRCPLSAGRRATGWAEPRRVQPPTAVRPGTAAAVPAGPHARRPRRPVRRPSPVDGRVRHAGSAQEVEPLVLAALATVLIAGLGAP